MSGESPFALARARVESAERLSPTFVRVVFAGPRLHEIGTPGRVHDQRIKLVFPSPGRAAPRLAGGADWFEEWRALPEGERGAMRTYSIRDLIVEEQRTRIAVDFVLHLAEGASGPASRWAARATPRDEILLLGPRRGRADAEGIEFAPGDARRILLAGDETAAPAIARILEDAARDLEGLALIEVPDPADALPIAAPPGVVVRWLPRRGADHGAALLPAVLDHVGVAPAAGVDDVGGEELLWETPSYSGLGEELATPGHESSDRYVWIAGESGVVTTLRRRLVRDLGIPRARVAFMGYWRRGVAMRG
jgi:NADPH-dependent ferric siderophore reductase